MNALASDKVADYINENFVATYMKVGTFQIINGQKVGGNVASYFCLPDGGVVHAVPGQVNADTLLSEARWAHEAHKFARMRATLLTTNETDPFRLRVMMSQAHVERYMAEKNPALVNRPKGAYSVRLPEHLPRDMSTQGQAHWYLAKNPLQKIDTVFPFVWEKILNEQLSTLPVARR